MSKLLFISIHLPGLKIKFLRFNIQTCCLIMFSTFPFTANAQIASYNAGQAFTCIAVDSNNNIWAGTNKAGLYFLNKKSNPATRQFVVASTGSLSTYNIQALAADQNQNVWVGHSGQGGSMAGGGGIERININNPSSVKHYSPDRNAECYTFLARDGITTLNSAALAVDKNGTVWSAHKYHDIFVEGSPPEFILGVPVPGTPAHYIVTPGGLSFKPAASTSFYSKGTYQDYRIGADSGLLYPAYTCDAPISKTPGSRNTYAVACGNDQTWLSVASYEAKNGIFYPARLLCFSSAGAFLNSFDFASIGISGGGIFNGLWVTTKGDVWATTGSSGFAVRRKGNWFYLNAKNLTCLFPPGTIINNNAIWGNKRGQVFIGTNKGLIVYNGTGPVSSVGSYTQYTSQNNSLLSDNILAGVSERDTTQWIVTDKGIMSSTLGRNYPSVADEIDYTSCTNKEINDIEEQSAQNLSSRKDYHMYRLETEVCTADGKNGKNCNAQYVYNLMKDHVIYTAPSPNNFPFDNLSPTLLVEVTNNELKEMIGNVNAWQSSSGDIKYMWDILTPSQRVKASEDLLIIKARLPFVEVLDAVGRQAVVEAQKNENPEMVISCDPEYLLYNSPNWIFDRAFYDITADLAFCGNKFRNPMYDPVRIFADDKNLTITNYAVNGHILNPGKIFRSVIEECGKVKIVTIGSGLNYCGSNLQGRVNGNGNVIGGSVIFKNVDFALKTAFEAIK